MTSIVVSDTVRVPAHAITVRATRASGPGGQNVNKVATRVELRVELALIEGLSEDARRRLQALVARRLDAEGRLLVTSQLTRIQSRNLEDARAKARELIAAALIRARCRAAPPGRREASRERRIAGKKQHGVTKRLRARPGDWS